uniref:Peptidase S1 domain-containing protein n=1 Tax=Ditylenchus dipsaci TaxID=166011 RepID=A0A915E5F5_9BILA
MHKYMVFQSYFSFTNAFNPNFLPPLLYPVFRCLFLSCWSQKWLRKLNYEEQQKIREYCTQHSTVQNRIIHGTFAQEGQFPHTVVLTQNDGSGGEMTLCTGTLITRRHIVTARHCFHTSDQASNFTLKVGGVCHSIGDGCDKDDMTVLHYDFAIFDNNSTLGSEADISIIQLKEDVSDDLVLSGEVSVACLPWKGEQHAKHLRYGFANFSKYDGNDYMLVAFSNTSQGQVGGDHGVKGGNTTGIPSDYQTIILNLSEYYEDLCFYIGLCPGSVEGLMPKLNMGGMFWHDIGARPNLLLHNTFGLFPTKPTKLLAKE